MLFGSTDDQRFQIDVSPEKGQEYQAVRIIGKDRSSAGRAVKILMRLPDDNISAAHLSVPYNGLIRQHDSLFAWRLEITVSLIGST